MSLFLQCKQELPKSPMQLFQKLWNYALIKKIFLPEAITLATANYDGRLSARIVLLKDFNEKGFTFYTNYQSKKGQQINENANAAMVIHWKELELQIRIEGKIKKTNRETSEKYFLTRPEGSNIGAWASKQSSIIESREELEQKVIEYTQFFKDNPLTRPEHWGGYILNSDLIEFWQGRENRLHDRIEYKKEAGKWNIRRLAP
ncbi:MAG: pyridoxamine 5'-phosphate oxidase [Bacteroidales bacterium]|nr:pyridoxamine 5'-phosphate oxidase [Bacteroidales bacterium]